METEGPEMPSAIAAVMVLILTGCRLGEILTLKWEHVDLDAGVLDLPDSKTGAKVVYLGQPAVEILRGAPRLPGNPWVIWGKKPGAQPVRPAGRLGAGARPRRPYRRPHPRPPPHLRIGRRRRRPRAADDWQAARAHASGDDSAVRASCCRSSEGRGGSRVERYREVNLR